jgi:2-polyprenyl-3-methyl-5-hydroxy-6-metoxy-1,4-benzoquinol methylase
MRIELITVWYNEEFFAPFFLNHYSWVDKIHVLLDADTNDRTESVAREYPNVEVQPVRFPDMMDDILKVETISNKYRTLTEADYVIVVDSDEFVFCNQIEKPVRLHLENTRKDVYFANLWQIYEHENDPPLDPDRAVPAQRRHGDPNMDDPFNISYIKPAIVKARKNLHWTPGNHELVYAGRNLCWRTRNAQTFRSLNVSVERREMLQGSHWRLVDLKQTIKRRIPNRRQRQSKVNLTQGLTIQYHHITEEEIIQEYHSNKRRPIVLFEDGFFAAARIVPAVPASALSVLDVGCAGGALGQALKELVSGRRVAGIEKDPVAAAHARELLDAVYQADVETFEPPFKEGEFDCLLFADVLEHLTDPRAVIRRLVRFLKPGGTLVASVPNARRLTLLRELADKGRSEYQDEGIAERTHLPFFTKAVFTALLEDAGIGQVTACHLSGEDLRPYAPAADGMVRIGRLCLQDVSPEEFEELSASRFVFVGKHEGLGAGARSDAGSCLRSVPQTRAPVAVLTHEWGFYGDEGGWQWMSEAGQLLAPASAAPSVFKAQLACGRLSWYASASRGQSPLELDLTVDGQTRQRFRFETDMQTLSIEEAIPASDKEVAIQLRSNKDYVPAENGINQDARHLSVRLINPRLDALSTTGQVVEPVLANVSAEETENPAHYVALAKTCLQKGDYVSRERLLLKALVLEPGNANLLAAVKELRQSQEQPSTPPKALKPKSGPGPNLAAPLARLNKLAHRRFPNPKLAAVPQAATLVAPAKRQTMPFCSAPWTIGWINETGTIQPCCRLGGFQRDLAKAGSLKAVWHGEEWVAFRNQVAQGEYPFDICRQCREASTYQTLGKDFAGVPQGYLSDLRARQLSKEEVDLCARLDAFFNGHNFTRFWLPAAAVAQVAQLLQEGRARRERVREAGNPQINKLLTLLQVYYDLYTRNPYPEIIMPFRVPVIATRCNARCVMCSMVVEGSIEHGKFMDDALLAKSLAHPDHIIKIWAASTEMLLHPRYQEIVSSLHKAHVHLAISTNAMPLTEAAARFLVDNKLKSLGFSINGATKEVFEGIMQRVSFERFVKNVRFFVDYNKSRGSPVGIGFTMVAMKRNIHQLPEVIRLIHSITGPGYGLHVSPLEAPATDKQRAFYEQEQPRNVPREQLSAIFKEAACVARELGMSISCFYYKNIGDVVRDLDNIPQVTW